MWSAFMRSRLSGRGGGGVTVYIALTALPQCAAPSICAQYWTGRGGCFLLALRLHYVITVTRTQNMHGHSTSGDCMLQEVFALPPVHRRDRKDRTQQTRSLRRLPMSLHEDLMMTPLDR